MHAIGSVYPRGRARNRNSYGREAVLEDPNFSSQPAKKTQEFLARRLFLGALAVCGLISVALYNGYPTVFSDTGGYLLTGKFFVALAPLRAPGYAVFTYITSLGMSAWYIVVAQAAMVVYVLYEACIFLVDGDRKFADLCFLASVCALVALTSLPWLPPKDAAGMFGSALKINEHGLALWFTTPLYFWLLWPKRFDGQPDRRWLYVVVALSAAIPAAMDLLYQNTGWRQFGYRFSNDYSVLLFILLAIGARPMRTLFAAAAAWSIAWNSLGAATFDKARFDRFYFRDGSQTVVYQPD